MCEESITAAIDIISLVILRLLTSCNDKYKESTSQTGLVHCTPRLCGSSEAHICLLELLACASKWEGAYNDVDSELCKRYLIAEEIAYNKIEESPLSCLPIC